MTARKSMHTSLIAPPRSIYRKIQRVLEEARREEADSFNKFVDNILKRGHLDFTYFKASSRGPAKPVPCKIDSIRKVVDLCMEFGLIDDVYKLTSQGLRALDSPNQYNRILSESVSRVLKRTGTPLDEIRQSIIDMLVNKKGRILPTWDVIYDQLIMAKGQCRKKDFRTYLCLLSECKRINYSRKKIYLP